MFEAIMEAIVTFVIVGSIVYNLFLRKSKVTTREKVQYKERVNAGHAVEEIVAKGAYLFAMGLFFVLAIRCFNTVYQSNTIEYKVFVTLGVVCLIVCILMLWLAINYLRDQFD